MKCPRCGAEMTIDGHRKIPLNMCYECGYIEGRSLEGEPETVTNYSHLKGLTLTEAATFLSNGLHLDESAVVKWLSGHVN